MAIDIENGTGFDFCFAIIPSSSCKEGVLEENVQVFLDAFDLEQDEWHVERQWYNQSGCAVYLIFFDCQSVQALDAFNRAVDSVKQFLPQFLPIGFRCSVYEPIQPQQAH